HQAAGNSGRRWMIAAVGNDRQNPAYRPTRPPISIWLGIMSIDHLLSPHRVRKKYKIDRRAGAIVAVGPEVGVGIERMSGAHCGPARPGFSVIMIGRNTGGGRWQAHLVHPPH